MKSGFCPKCSANVEKLDKQLFLMAVQNNNGRVENIVNNDYSTTGIFVSAFICSSCNYTEFYQEDLK